MALMIGRRPGERVRIGSTVMTVASVGDGAVTVRLRPGGVHTLASAEQRLELWLELATVQARPHPQRPGAAQLRISAPRSVAVLRGELEREPTSGRRWR
jgi:sRNA-binding carbon storage regulator CsrA